MQHLMPDSANSLRGSSCQEHLEASITRTAPPHRFLWRSEPESGMQTRSLHCSEELWWFWWHWGHCKSPRCLCLCCIKWRRSRGPGHTASICPSLPLWDTLGHAASPSWEPCFLVQNVFLRVSTGWTFRTRKCCTRIILHETQARGRAYRGPQQGNQSCQHGPCPACPPAVVNQWERSRELAQGLSKCQLREVGEGGWDISDFGRGNRGRCSARELSPWTSHPFLGLRTAQTTLWVLGYFRLC